MPRQVRFCFVSSNPEYIITYTITLKVLYNVFCTRKKVVLNCFDDKNYFSRNATDFCNKVGINFDCQKSRWNKL